MTPNLRNEKGVALVGTVGLLLVLVTVGMAFLKMSAYESDSADVRYNQLRAFWKAEEALSRTRAQITKVREPDGHKYPSLDSPDERLSALCTVKKMTGNDFTAYEIKAEVFFKDGEARDFFSLSSVEKPKTICDYFMLIHEPGDYPELSPYFDTGDRIDGHFHTNTYFTLTGSPVFLELVTTGDPFPGYKTLPFQRYTAPAHIENTGEIFTIPKVAEKLRAEAQYRIVLHSEQRAVILLTGNGFILKSRDLHNEQMVRFVESVSFPKGKSYGIFAEGDVEVSGMLEGRVTIGSSGDIYITDDILYVDANPQTGEPKAGSKNVLGLMAEGNVLVKQKQVVPYIGKGIRIDASVMAMDSVFSVVNYRDNYTSMGIMHLWGNVVQYQRGIIGNVRLRGTVQMGYIKDWHYDKRLSNLPPPYMPPLTDEKGYMRFRTVYWARPDV